MFYAGTRMDTFCLNIPVTTGSHVNCGFNTHNCLELAVLYKHANGLGFEQGFRVNFKVIFGINLEGFILIGIGPRDQTHSRYNTVRYQYYKAKSVHPGTGRLATTNVK